MLTFRVSPLQIQDPTYDVVYCIFCIGLQYSSNNTRSYVKTSCLDSQLGDPPD